MKEELGKKMENGLFAGEMAEFRQWREAEELKARNQLERAGRMNNIRNRADNRNKKNTA